MSSETEAIFFDEREKRWRRARGILTVATVTAGLLLSVFAFAVFEGPVLPRDSTGASRSGALTLFAGRRSAGGTLRWPAPNPKMDCKDSITQRDGQVKRRSKIPRSKSMIEMPSWADGIA